MGSGVIPTPGGVGVRMRALHEWFARPGGSLALLPLIDLVRRGFASGTVSRIVWIGRRVFPYPLAIARLDAGLLGASVFVDPPSGEARVWAIDLVLRTATPTAVIADGCGMALAQTRRVQLAAGTGRGIALLARSSDEEGALSAATTRWRVEACASVGAAPSVGWRLTLLRNKDQRALTDEARTTVVEWSDAQGAIAVPAVVERGAGGASAWAGGAAAAGA